MLQLSWQDDWRNSRERAPVLPAEISEVGKLRTAGMKAIVVYMIFMTLLMSIWTQENAMIGRWGVGSHGT
jgi:hypothetical protein